MGKKMNKLQKINLIKRTLSYPVRLIFLIPVIIIGFFSTDFEDEFDRGFYKETIKNLYKF